MLYLFGNLHNDIKCANLSKQGNYYMNNLCAECGHPEKEHPKDWAGGTSCIRDYDADYDYERERYVKCGGCDCPEFIEPEGE
jgi:hypothetical protein